MLNSTLKALAAIARVVGQTLIAMPFLVGLMLVATPSVEAAPTARPIGMLLDVGPTVKLIFDDLRFRSVLTYTCRESNGGDAHWILMPSSMLPHHEDPPKHMTVISVYAGELWCEAGTGAPGVASRSETKTKLP